MNWNRYANSLGPVSQTANTPAPFPGDTPTRVIWSWNARLVPNPKRRLSGAYAGKPNFEQNQRLANLWYAVRAGAWNIQYDCREFDRKNLLLHQEYETDSGRLNTLLSPLWSVYWPWSSAGNCLQHLSMGFFRVRLGGQWLYSPWEHPSDAHIRSYQSWLAETIGKRPAPKAAPLFGEQLLDNVSTWRFVTTPAGVPQPRNWAPAPATAEFDMTGHPWPRGMVAPRGYVRTWDGTLRRRRPAGPLAAGEIR